MIKCECGNKKVANPRGKPLEQILNINGVAIVGEEDTGEFYGVNMNAKGSIRSKFFSFYFE